MKPLYKKILLLIFICTPAISYVSFFILSYLYNNYTYDFTISLMDFFGKLIPQKFYPPLSFGYDPRVTTAIVLKSHLFYFGLISISIIIYGLFPIIINRVKASTENAYLTKNTKRIFICSVIGLIFVLFNFIILQYYIKSQYDPFYDPSCTHGKILQLC